MINTRITNIDDFSKVLELGSKVKREVNKMYKTLELEIDGVFKPLLLLKKKKYAAVKVSQATDATFTYEKEMKGLDLVRRDWCIQSKETGRFVIDQILSGRECELVVDTIHQHMEELANKMRNDELPLDKYVITKGLSKHPNDYPDGKSQPHVNVAKSMILHNRPVNIGDHIPFVITLLPDPIDESNSETQPKKLSYAERARHPEEILRSAGVLKPDIEWYLTQQILPPIVRLCEPIAGTSQSIIAEKLGLDTSKFRNEKANHYEEDDLLDYTPAMNLSDEERFKDVEKLLLTCEACGEQSEYHGAIYMKDGKMLSGLCCSNPNCVAPNLWGASSRFEVFAIIYNEVLLNIQMFVRRYYRGILTCDELSCALETTQQSVLGDHCLARGCMGRLKPKYTEIALYNQLKYYHAMFDIDHACNQLGKSETSFGSTNEMKSAIPPSHLELLANLRQTTQRYLSLNAYNFIEPNIWVALFGKGSGGKKSQ
jgi:DNA polymerase alpha subunit A